MTALKRLATLAATATLALVTTAASPKVWTTRSCRPAVMPRSFSTANAIWGIWAGSMVCSFAAARV